VWRGDPEAAEVFFHTQANQHPSCVGAQLNSGAHLTELRCAFDRADLETRLLQGDRRGEPTDARPHDDDLRHVACC
jgi:hypothetical protein